MLHLERVEKTIHIIHFECCTYTSYINEMGRAQSDTYSSLFNNSDNVNFGDNFDRKSMFVNVLRYINNTFESV